MAQLKWGNVKERIFEAGVSKGVVYPNGGEGVVWNGLISVNYSPDGDGSNYIYAGNKIYGRIITPEIFKGSIEAFAYPKAFMPCVGERPMQSGIVVRQRKRVPFHFCYRTEKGNAASPSSGYKLHLIYNALVSPSERSHKTISDGVDVVSYSWDFTSMPICVEGYDQVSEIVIDSEDADWINLAELEKILYGLDGGVPMMPTPDTVVDILQMNNVKRMIMDVLSLHGHWIWDTFNFNEDTVQIAIERESLRHIYEEPGPSTEFIQPSVAVSLLQASLLNQIYSVVVIDEHNPSELGSDLEAALSMEKKMNEQTGQWDVTQDASGFYHYPYTLTI